MHLKCQKCSAVFSTTSAPAACPVCDSLSVVPHYSIVVNDCVQITDHVQFVVATAEHEVRAFSESSRNGVAATTELLPDGTLNSSITGLPPQGEADTPDVCRILVETLNEQEPWRLQPSHDIADDGIAINCSSEKQFPIQVVRIEVDTSFWQRLSSTGSVSRTLEVDFLAERLKAAIDHKADRLPQSSRAGVILALDANRLSAYAFNPVVSCFRDKHRTWAEGLNFESIWVVGPAPRLTRQVC